MTKKHYKMIANVIKSAKENVEVNDYSAYYLASQLAFAFEADNNKFDKGRFLTACGFTQ